MENRDWQHQRKMWIGVLESRSGESLATWNARVAKQRPKDRKALAAWLTSQGVTGYAQDVLIMERFGYPEWVTASATQLVDAQYEGRPALRKIYDKVIKTATGLGEVAVQTRKTYVSLVTPRRTFARVQAAKNHVKLALKLEKVKPGGRLQRSKIHEGMAVEVALAKAADVDKEVAALMRAAYEENS